MDSNDDVELVASRPYTDKDEVYPLEELFDDEPDYDNEDDAQYKPRARRQNRCFACAIASMVAIMFLSVALYSVLPMMLSNGSRGDANAQTAASMETTLAEEQGTVSNNAENAHAKVSEVMNAPHKNPNTNNKNKGHAHAALPVNVTEGGGDVTTANNGDDSSATKPEQPAQDSSGEEGPKEDKHHKPDYEAWHKTRVTKDDGVMYTIEKVLEHDPKSFTEGLTYFDGKLYESVGLNKQSAVLVLDPETGRTLDTIEMEGKYFGEGLTYYHGQLIQLTYKAETGFVYDADNLKGKPHPFTYETTTREGWGLTYDDHKDELIVSDGSAYLHFWDPKTFKQIRKHQIMRLDGTPAKHINELEYWRGRVLANVWYKHVLLVINPTTGLVEKEYDFNDIWETAGLTPNVDAEVFNGISITDDPDTILVTGKWWSNMFRIKLLPLVEDTV